MPRLAWLLLILAGGPLPAVDAGAPVQFLGGTLPALAARSEGRIDLSGDSALLFRTRNAVFEIPYAQIQTLEYGQHVDRRYVEAVLLSPLFLLSKSRKHFVTLGFVDGQGRRQVVVFRIGKNAVRPVLAALEARTGRRVEYQDEQARKSGKG